MQLEELSMNKKMGENDGSLTDEIRKHKDALEAKNESLLKELQSYWKEWDASIDHSPAASDARAGTIRKMVDVLNRRNYIRNLVRDVNAALEE
jgi:molecular chaperone HscB